MTDFYCRDGGNVMHHYTMTIGANELHGSACSAAVTVGGVTAVCPYVSRYFERTTEPCTIDGNYAMDSSQLRW